MEKGLKEAQKLGWSGLQLPEFIEKQISWQKVFDQTDPMSKQEKKEESVNDLLKMSTILTRSFRTLRPGETGTRRGS